MYNFVNQNVKQLPPDDISKFLELDHREHNQVTMVLEAA